VILCEGYTDTIALHQAGMRNAVGLMGTALTAEQVGELARMAQTVLLALDADSAGQEAMLRAYGLAEKRRLELRVVPLPAGTDPAELLQREGKEAMDEAIGRSVPFVRFRVEATLEQGDRTTPEGRDRIIEQLRPVFAALPDSAMRMELVRIVSGRLELSERLAERLLATGPRREAGGRPSNGAGRRIGDLTRREESERAFLALCIALPDEGERALAGLDLDEHFDSELLRRAAGRLREGSPRAPLADSAGEGPLDEDPELARLLAELIVEAGREEPRPAMLEVQRLQLELARVERLIRRARGREGADVLELAERRAELKREFDSAYGRALEQTGDRGG
jgi:DNA primase